MKAEKPDGEFVLAISVSSRFPLLEGGVEAGGTLHGLPFLREGRKKKRREELPPGENLMMNPYGTKTTSLWCYFSNCRASCGDWFAWASIAAAACCRIWFLVRLDDSEATSTLRIRDSEAEVFSIMVERLLAVDSSRLTEAPNVPRVVFTESNAVSRAAIAFWELAWLERV